MKRSTILLTVGFTFLAMFYLTTMILDTVDLATGYYKEGIEDSQVVGMEH